MKVRRFQYTKDNGDISERRAIIVAEPRENYLVYDVSNLNDHDFNHLVEALEDSEIERDKQLKIFENLTGIKLNSLWRSFKPGGIEWME